MLRHRPGPLALLAASALLPGAALEQFGAANVAISGRGHFFLVAIAAGVAAFASAGLTATAVRRRDGQAALLGTAFSTMTAMLAVHGLATPGVVFGPNGVVALAGGLSLPVGAGLLALTALPRLRDTRRMGPLLALQAALAVAVFALGAAGLAWPELVPAVPASGSRSALVLMIGGASLYALLADRAMRTFALTRRRDDLVVAVGCAWLAVAAVATLTRTPGSAGFYLGHLLEITGVLLLGVPVARDLRRRGASWPLVGDLTAAEVVASEEAYMGPRVRSLMVRLGAHDGSTEGHSRRVALLAVQVGEALGLPPATLRHLAVGGLLHDVGKLSIGGAVLRKPGALTDVEYTEIKRHPEAGVQMLRALGGFPAAVHALVGEHHEAPRRRRLPERPRRLRPRGRAADPRRLRRLRRPRLRPRLPRGVVDRSRPRAPAGAGGHGVRPGVRRVARARRRGRRRPDHAGARARPRHPGNAAGRAGPRRAR
jgi:putative nucleotidyltransferase with HDIG domain